MQVTGIALAHNRLTLCTLDGTVKNFSIIDAGAVELPVQENRFDSANVKAARSFLSDKTVVKKNIFAAFPAHMCYVRRFVLPFTDDDHIARIVEYEIEHYIDIPSEESILDFFIFKKTADSAHILAVVCRKVDLGLYLDFLNTCGIDPIAVEVDLAGYKYIHNAIYPQDQMDTIFIDCGSEDCSEVFFSQGRLVDVRCFPYRSGEKTSTGSAQKLDSTNVDTIVREIERDLVRNNFTDEVRCAFIKNDVDTSALEAALTAKTHCTVETIDCAASFKNTLAGEEEGVRADALAMGIMGLVEDPFQVGLRKKEFTYKNKLENVKRDLFIALAVAILFFCAIGGVFFYQKGTFTRQTDALIAKQQELWKQYYPDRALPADVAYALEALFAEREAATSGDVSIPQYRSALEMWLDVQGIFEGYDFSWQKVEITQKSVSFYDCQLPDLKALADLRSDIDKTGLYQSAQRNVLTGPDSVSFDLILSIEAR